MNEARSPGSNVVIRYSIFLIVAAASLFVSWIGFDLFEQNQSSGNVPVNLKIGTLLPQPKPLANVHLIDTAGKPFTFDNFRNHWTVMAIGYTSCPDVCPTLMAAFKAMDRILNPEGTTPVLNFLFVSVDPERDSPEQIGKYVRYFNPRFLGATGKNQEALHQLTGQLGLMYARSADSPTSAMGYMIDHSAAIILINPKSEWNAIFSPPHDPQTVAEDVQAVIASYKK